MIDFTLLTSSNGSTATKTVSLDKDGNIKKKSGIISEAIAEKKTVNNINEFAIVLDNLNATQCLCYGVTDSNYQRINSAKSVKAGEMARTKENFHWPIGAAGILFIDCDKPDIKEEFLLNALYSAEPLLQKAPTLIARSTSHGLYSDTNEKPSHGGYHIYILIDNAQRIPQLGEIIYERLWQNNHGYHEMNSSIDNPAVLERCLIDKSVWQTNRIDYSAKPVLKAGVRRNEVPVRILNGDMPPLNTEQLKPLQKTDRDTIRALKEFSRQKVDQKVEIIRSEMIEMAPEDEQPIIEKRFSLLKEHRLALDHEIRLMDGSFVSIRQIQDNPDAYHLVTCCDPIEPEYRDYAEVAIIYTDSDMPMIHTMAHGGATYSCEMIYEEAVQVDFTQFFKTQAALPRAEVKNKNGDKFEFSDWPKELRSYGGAFGDFIEWSLHNSKAPSFCISLVSALQEFAVVLGRDFRTSHDNYSNLNITVVGDTGCGKEQILKNAAKVRLETSKMYPDEKKSFMGEVTSQGAIFTALEDFPRRHMVVDEYGAWLKNVFSSRGDSKKQEVVKMLMELYGRVSDTMLQTTYSQKGVKKEERVTTPDIEHPFVCFTGISNPADIVACVNEDMIRNGFVNRNLFFFPTEGIRATNLTQKTPLPESFKSWYEVINMRVQEANDGVWVRDNYKSIGKQIILRLSPEADALFQDMDNNYKVKRAKELKDTPFYHLMPRVAEIALRLSLIFELSARPMSIEISESSFAKAEALVRFLKEEEIRFWQLHLSVNEEEKSKKELYKFILSSKMNGVDKSAISKRFQKFKGNRINEMLTDLMESGMIVEERIPTPSGKGRPKTIYYSAEYMTQQ